MTAKTHIQAVAVIFGQQDSEYVHAHTADCADIRRYRSASEREDWAHPIEVSSVREIVEYAYPSGDFCYDPDDADDRAGYWGDVRVFPCVDLPDEVAPVGSEAT